LLLGYLQDSVYNYYFKIINYKFIIKT